MNKKGKLPIVDENGDYIWRFPLNTRRESPSDKGNNAFIELFRSQLDEMLKLVVLTQGDKKVRVDGFYLINQPECKYKIWKTDKVSD